MASQEPDATFARVQAGAVDAVKEKLLIKWKDKPQARRQCRRTYKAGEGVRAVAVCRDGSRRAYAAGRQVVVRDFRTGFVVSQMRGHSARVNCVDFSPDGLTIASGSGSDFENDNSVRVWDVKTGKQLWQLNVGSLVYSVRFSPSGDTVAAGCGNGTVQIIDVATAEVKRPLRGHRYAPSLSKECFLSFR